MSNAAPLLIFPGFLNHLGDRRNKNVEVPVNRRDSEDRRAAAGGERLTDELLGEVKKLLKRDRTDHAMRLITAAGISTLVAIAGWTVHRVDEFSQVMPSVSAFMSTTTVALNAQNDDIRRLQLTSVGAASKEDLVREVNKLQSDIGTMQTRLSVVEQALKRRN